jgi:hypothetical protein
VLGRTEAARPRQTLAAVRRASSRVSRFAAARPSGGNRRSPIGYIQSLRKVGGRNATVGGMAPSACWPGECQRKGPRPGLPLGKQATAQ